MGLKMEHSTNLSSAKNIDQVHTGRRIFEVSSAPQSITNETNKRDDCDVDGLGEIMLKVNGSIIYHDFFGHASVELQLLGKFEGIGEFPCQIQKAAKMPQSHFKPAN